MVLVGAGTARAGRRRAGDDCWRTRCSSPRCSSPSASSTTRPARATCASSPVWAAGCPVLAVIGGLAALSMAGVPPLLGFVAKEAAFDALLDGGLPATRRRRSCSPVLVVGSALTAAYTLALLVGRVRPQARPAGHRPRRAGAPAGCAVPGAPACSRWPGSSSGRPPAARPAGRRPTRRPCRAAPEAEHLALWHGLQPALLLSALSLAGGAALFAAAPAGRPAAAPRRRRRLGATRATERRPALDRLAVLVTGTTQRGLAARLPRHDPRRRRSRCRARSLLTRAPWPGEWRAWDTPVQALSAPSS